jgi:hypothetical protein
MIFDIFGPLRFLVIIYGFLLFITQASAQPEVSDVRFLQSETMRYVRIFGMSEGRYVYTWQTERGSGLRIALLDSQSTELSRLTTDIEMQADMEILSDYFGKKRYLLIHDGRMKRADLIEIDGQEQTIREIRIDQAARLKPESIFATPNFLLIYGENRVDGPSIMRYDLANGELKTQSIGRERKWLLELADIEITEDKPAVALLRFSSRRQNLYWLQQLDDNMQLTGERLRLNEKQPLSDAYVIRMSKGWLVCGLMSENKERSMNGFFSVKVSDAWTAGPLNWIRLQEMKTFFSYMDPQRRQRITSTANQLNRHKRALQISSRSLLHEPRRQGNTVIIAAEFCFPTYINVATPMPGGFASTTEFDGFQYTHTSFLIFDSSGAFIRDLSMPINLPYKPMAIRQRTEWYFNQGQLYAYYLSGSALRWAAMNYDNAYGILQSMPVLKPEDSRGFIPSYLDLSRCSDQSVRGVLLEQGRRDGLGWNRNAQSQSYFFRILEN